MYKQDLLESEVYEILLLYFQIQERYRKDRFLKLSTEIELVDMTLKHLQDQNSQKFRSLVTDWSRDDRYFRVLKIRDNLKIQMQNQQTEIQSILEQYDAFLIIQQQENSCYLYKDSTMNGKLNLFRETSSLHEGQLSVVLKYSIIQGNNKQRHSEYYPNICRLLNLAYITNSISFKYISLKDLYFLEKCSLETFTNFDIVEKIINLFDMISFESISQLELLISLLSLQPCYMSIDKEYKTEIDYFDNPTDKTECFSQIIRGRCTRVKVEDLNVYIMSSERFKEFISLVLINNQLQTRQSCLQVRQFIQRSCTQKQQMLLLIELKTNNTEPKCLEYIKQVLERNPKLLKPYAFKNSCQQPYIQIESIASLYLSIQQELGMNLYCRLSQEDQEMVKNKLKVLLFENFILNKL